MTNGSQRREAASRTKARRLAPVLPRRVATARDRSGLSFGRSARSFGRHVTVIDNEPQFVAVLHDALAESKTPLAAAPSGNAAPPSIDLDTAALDRTLGAKGTNNGGIYQYGIARAEPVQEEDMVVPASMGLANAINFQPLGGGKAAITGDFVLTDKEVAPVMKALRENGIEVTALHNHMVGEQPRLYFMHFWAHDDAQKLATGLKAALAHVNLAKG